MSFIENLVNAFCAMDGPLCDAVQHQRRQLPTPGKHINRGLFKFGDSGRQRWRLLQERRTALISDAVTGKIDVRNAIASRPAVAV